MLRISRRARAVGGALLLSISISIACGESLPVPSDPAPDAVTEAGADVTNATDASTDAGTDSSVDAHDAAGGEGPCTTEHAYGDASPLDNFEGLGAVSSVRLNRDGGTIAYVSADLGNATSFDIGELDYPAPLAPLPANIRSTTAPEENPAPLADDRTVFWDQPIDGGARRIFSSVRANPGQNLESPVEEQIPLGTKTQVSMPWSVSGTNVFYFVLQSQASGSAQIQRSVRTGSSWSAPTVELDGSFDFTHPVVTDDEMVLYFALSEFGGKRRIYYAKRSAPGAPFGLTLPMEGDVNTTDHDSQPTWISQDQCTLIFTSNRSGGMRPYKIERVRGR